MNGIINICEQENSFKVNKVNGIRQLINLMK